MAISEERKKEIEEEKYRYAVVSSITHEKHTVSQKYGMPLLLSVFSSGLELILDMFRNSR